MLDLTKLETRQTIVLIASLLLLAGCGTRGPKLGMVAGKVTMDGQPLPEVIVTFVPAEGGVSSSGLTNQDGVYLLSCSLGQGAVVGQHRVYVQSKPPNAPGDSLVPDEDDPSYRPDPYASVRAPVFEEKLPARYNTNSELVREVKPGKNMIDLELTSQP